MGCDWANEMIGMAPAAAQAASPKIAVQHLEFAYPGARGGTIMALAGLNLAVPDGQFCCIVGPSGCGKSTLLRLLAGLEQPTRGNIAVRHDNPALPVNSMVFQGDSTFPWLTVRENVAYGLAQRHVPAALRVARVATFLDMVGLRSFSDAYPGQLSGGMRQRVSLARALANDPEILLMDEPFASLDEQNRLLLQLELLRIWETERKTVVFVTHSIDEALLLGDRVLLMSARPGRLLLDELVAFPRPRDPYTLKREAAFGDMAYRIWELLRREVNRARDIEMQGVA
ncbi:MAG: ABC transporter ATP-binding protein [Chloroflexi bacterium]|nr:ABC transporter ATP-binding protein [Chloroflexota bacterium]